MIQIQFKKKNIQVLKIDNARGFFNSIFGSYLQSHAIVHQSSCINTPQQNGVAKHKNRHLLEVARSLLFSSHLPKWLWGMLSSRVLKFKASLQILLTSYPHSHLMSSIPFCVFGCAAVVHVISHNEANSMPVPPNESFLATLPIKNAMNVTV